jgi:CBS domain-containing protein
MLRGERALPSFVHRERDARFLHVVRRPKEATMITVREILRKKGSFVAQTSKEHTVLEAAREMNTRRIGSLVVVEQGRPVGMFTERDILTRVVAEGRDPATTRVGEVMTNEIVCCALETSVEDCKQVVSAKRIRHIPVVDGDAVLVGIVTSGDLLARDLEDSEETIAILNEYIHGPILSIHPSN